MIRKLYTYVFKEHIFPFIGALFVFSFIFLVQYLISQIDKLVGKNLGLGVVSEFLLLSLAPILAEVVPVAVFIAVLMAFGRFGEDNEITAWRASGISFSKILIPSLIFGTLVMGFMLYYNNSILPDANHKYKLLRRDITYKHPDINFDAGYFLEDIPNYRILIHEKDSDTLRGILVYHDAGSIRETIWAETGQLEIRGDRVILNLNKGEYHELSTNLSEEYKYSQFERYRLAVEVENLELRRRDSKLRSDREMSIPDMLKKVDEFRDLQVKSQLNFKKNIAAAGIDSTDLDFKEGFIQLDARMKALKDSVVLQDISKTERFAIQEESKKLKNSKMRCRSFFDMNRRYQKAESKYLVEVHKKIVMPVAAVIFVLIGAPLGMIVRRGGLGISGGISLVFFLVYWAMLMTGERLADRLLIAPWLAMWGANIFFALAGLILVNYAIHERVTLRVPKWIRGLIKTKDTLPEK